ncbi:MerR family transcriptional regulator [Pseudodesulfovibrio sp. zrk46]|uniref:MerR family transcriptional regulator n=1 Tax=Pseudodesulfovibrio sp. zrk46 TaxID=2725288 RepID=UPI0014491B2A|nr:MerR family transcriptional regulator [Pseudodesulfovibrio sp. zrk46]QJB55166.1 MerR family transcriptional regulator [Pseudodesulfovibrio sp. zrk46]
MTISEIAKRTGLTAHTLRYYEKIGLIRDVERGRGRRMYTEKDVEWLLFIVRLKETGMPLKQIEQYARLRYEGDTTLSERKAMLFSHRKDLKRNIDQLRGHLKALDKKIAIYETWEKEYDEVRERAGKAE